MVCFYRKMRYNWHVSTTSVVVNSKMQSMLCKMASRAPRAIAAYGFKYQIIFYSSSDTGKKAAKLPLCGFWLSKAIYGHLWGGYLHFSGIKNHAKTIKYLSPTPQIIFQYFPLFPPFLFGTRFGKTLDLSHFPHFHSSQKSHKSR